MQVTRTDQDTETVLKVEGTLDATTAPELQPMVDALVAERRLSVTIALSGLKLIDSSGVGVIVSLFKRCRANGGAVRIVGIRDQPRAIFRLLRLDRAFNI